MTKQSQLATLPHYKRLKFTDQENLILTDIKSKDLIKCWNSLAIELHVRSGQALRSGRQCRERWKNHLDPDITNRPWTK